ncbi:MAG: pyruvate:ferredoxin (flavodoxin) oxidoreductase [Peptococcaceae bacterium]|nr:pyruvate:ferredoxin (flavodoxin) oxidoreductase [Peptococcaceae bacterium]
MSTMKTMDGNEAAAYASYAFSEVAAIYPITPSSTMAEFVDEWSAYGKKNIFDQTVNVIEMHSEGGAAGTLHGSLQAGALTTTYTASQGLLLMIPNMYKIAGELLPTVFHVSARALAANALSIFGDHQDVMSTRQTGFAMISSTSVQESLDLGYLAHLCSIESRIPFLHFFDGFRTSHEVQKINAPDYDEIATLLNREALQAFRANALNPEHPCLRGTAANPDIYFQHRESANRFHDAVPGIVIEYMKKYKALTGREYQIFQYHGAPDAEYVVIAMGSVCDTISETVDYMNKQGEKVGLIKVRLYRPFSAQHLCEAIPATVKKIAVLDRTKEPGSLGEPLYLDVVGAFAKNQPQRDLVIVGGRYGLASKETTPSHILSVYDNLKQDQPKNGFTIGITDDVTHLSLPNREFIDLMPEGTISCQFWGLGADGTVGANKQAIKIIGDNTDLYAQAYFSYDSKKSGGATVSHLRFGKTPIKAPYLVNSADYVGCHNQAYVTKYNLIKSLKPGGIFVLNCQWTPEDLETKLPGSLKREIADKKVDFYIIDAVKIARHLGLGGRINMIMQSAFFSLTKVIPIDQAIEHLKASIVKTYSRKGQAVVDMNNASVDAGITALQKIDIPATWGKADKNDGIFLGDEQDTPFVKNILRIMAAQEGDSLPVSTFTGMEDGSYPPGTCAFEKRGIAVVVPEWIPEHCIQCNQCAYICPHACIRPFLLDDTETTNASETFPSIPAVGKDLAGYNYRIQLSPLDCTGCGNCAEICPGRQDNKALVMQPAMEQTAVQHPNWEHAVTLANKDHLITNKFSVKNSQFLQPLLEFSGACPGCGETAYVKLLTQLYGDRMMIANATGCSMIWGGSAPSNPYAVNAKGQGPSWGNSLFEDNAEYGYGMHLGVEHQRAKLAEEVAEAIQTEHLPGELQTAFQEWLAVKDQGEGSRKASEKAVAVFAQAQLKGEIDLSIKPLLAKIWSKKDIFTKKSVWLIGGDGWAYDIGFAGLDHVLASGADVNMLVMDTEVYSNTGGQSSKATPHAAVAKFATAGKQIRKKDLGMMAMSYGYVYVAQISMGSSYTQTLRAIQEAEAYPGPSLIIAYAPCINHGIVTGMSDCLGQADRAVASGYWHLYRYNPLLQDQGKNPFILDSKAPSTPFRDFLMSEVRYTSLQNTFPASAEEMFVAAEKAAHDRYMAYKRLADMDFSN